MQISPQKAAAPRSELPPRKRGVFRWLRTLCRLALRVFVLCLAGTMAITILFRWVPLPCSSLMIQRQVASLWEKEKEYRFRYQWVALEKMSPYAPLAAIASEDQKFFSHMGFDFEAIEKAWEHNQRRKRVHGASTISQQVAKNLFLWPGRSFIRKGLEVYFTLLLEGLWPKHRILEVYLNVAEFGPGIFGVEAASKVYFHKSAAKLNSAEAAILAAILPSPLRSSAARPSGYISERAWHIQQQMRLMGGTESLRKPLGQKAKKRAVKK
ncbi:monofunctional biosynthetic peptidoglycan transglycosylase [Thiovibrio frasassiensis]|uniref:Biosynthetic peptidoglycan transglycosylase n=1 Tax=Thiovibrio frasassiensis TaxID=2984131 RepID=A0A9X4ME24_9BACT|nr:monofunctional biosynthetic peptidoglycan transglycosylase [Thiovibrio frasassiensis]MDG4474588.1 monofunctional biosynthetic peptidoglycan transglycosylase [Thiovibrio frasassiensis]